MDGIGIIFWLGFVILVGYYANKKGRNAVGWGLLAFIISPLIAGIALAIAGDKTVEKKIEDLDNKTDNMKLEMEYNQKYNDLRSDRMEKKLSEASGNNNHRNLTENEENNLIETSEKQKKIESKPMDSITDSMIERLTKLNELKAQGILTEEEFNEQKKRILSDS